MAATPAPKIRRSLVDLQKDYDSGNKAPLEARSDMRVLLSLNGLSLLFFGIFPQQLMGMCVVALTRSY